MVLSSVDRWVYPSFNLYFLLFPTRRDINLDQVENSEASEISEIFFWDFQIRVFDFGCRAKSETRKPRKWAYFLLKPHHKVSFFLLGHFSISFWILSFIYYQKFKQKKTLRDFRVFYFGCRAKSETRKPRKWAYFLLKPHNKVSFFLLGHFSVSFWILSFIYYQKFKQKKTLRDFRVFHFGCRAKSKTWKTWKLVFFSY